jgi:FdhD protein
MSTSSTFTVAQWEGGQSRVVSDPVASEVPVALAYNRRSHVVMMATPADLEDLGLGFSLTEGIVETRADLRATRILPRGQGLELAMTVTEPCFERLERQRRNLTGRTGCGLCGAESLQQAIRVPKPVPHALRTTHAALQRAIMELETHQPLQEETGAVHGAAWCDAGGRILALREDVGRHNALDKLIGHRAGAETEARGGFIVVSSRASYEMVYKVAAAGVELLLAVSAPTTLAIEFAQRSGMTLVGFARPGRHNIYTFPERVGPEQVGPEDD